MTNKIKVLRKCIACGEHLNVLDMKDTDRRKFEYTDMCPKCDKGIDAFLTGIAQDETWVDDFFTEDEIDC